MTLRLITELSLKWFIIVHRRLSSCINRKSQVSSLSSISSSKSQASCKSRKRECSRDLNPSLGHESPSCSNSISWICRGCVVDLLWSCTTCCFHFFFETKHVQMLWVCCTTSRMTNPRQIEVTACEWFGICSGEVWSILAEPRHGDVRRDACNTRRRRWVVDLYHQDIPRHSSMYRASSVTGLLLMIVPSISTFPVISFLPSFSLPSNRQYLSCDDCLEVRRENNQSILSLSFFRGR